MPPQKSEELIVQLIEVIKAVKVESLYTEEQKREKIREIEAQIKDLRKN